MPSFSDIIRSSGKGSDDSKDIIYLLDINIGGTLGQNATGTETYANLGRDVDDVYYKSKLQNTGVISRSVQPENGQFETSDLSISLANGDLEFSKWPWNYSILNRPSVLRMGFHSSSGGIEYLADCSYMADCSITASGGPLGAGSPGDISVGIAYTLFKGIIKTEERSNKEFRLSIGDYSNKIFKTIPPRIVKVTEFPNIGTSVIVLGTKTDFDTDLVGKKIPYIYGDFSSVLDIKPLFIDTVKKRYLIADHAIGTVSKVISGGTQVYNYTFPSLNGLVGGTHIGTNIMSFIDFGTSQGTKSVYVSITGRYDIYGTMLQNSVLILKDILTSTNLCGLSSNDIGTASFDVAEAFLNTFNFRYIMNGEIHDNTMDLIQDLSVNSLANFYFDKENQANFSIYRPAVSRTYIRKIQQHEILEDSFSITRDVRDVYNRVLVNYDYDWIKKEYRNAYEIGGTSYISQFDTTRTFVIDASFIYTSTEASYVGRKWLSKLQNGLNKINFSVPISALPLDIGERIQLSHDEPPTASGGWTDRLINVTEFEINNRSKLINISAIDEQEVNIGQKYFILGNGTAFHRSASEAQRYYGALCSAGGTMSNGDSGYRLW